MRTGDAVAGALGRLCDLSGLSLTLGNSMLALCEGLWSLARKKPSPVTMSWRGLVVSGNSKEHPDAPTLAVRSHRRLAPEQRRAATFADEHAGARKGRGPGAAQGSCGAEAHRTTATSWLAGTRGGQAATLADFETHLLQSPPDRLDPRRLVLFRDSPVCLKPSSLVDVLARVRIRSRVGVTGRYIECKPV